MSLCHFWELAGETKEESLHLPPGKREYADYATDRAVSGCVLEVLREAGFRF